MQTSKLPGLVGLPSQEEEDAQARASPTFQQTSSIPSLSELSLPFSLPQSGSPVSMPHVTVAGIVDLTDSGPSSQSGTSNLFGIIKVATPKKLSG